MTTIVVVRVEEGAVVASDSAITPVNETGEVERSYAGATKVFGLRDDPPAAIAGFGLASLPPAVSQLGLVGELRRRARNLGSLAEVAKEALAIFGPPYKELLACHPEWSTGFLVLGFSEGSSTAELHELSFSSEAVELERIELEDEIVTCRDSTGAIYRIVAGHDEDLPGLVGDALGLSEEQMHKPGAAVAGLEAPLAEYSMPLPEARELARYLVETAAGYARFSPGLRQVDGPTQVAILRRPCVARAPRLPIDEKALRRRGGRGAGEGRWAVRPRSGPTRRAGPGHEHALRERDLRRQERRLRARHRGDSPRDGADRGRRTAALRGGLPHRRRAVRDERGIGHAVGRAVRRGFLRATVKTVPCRGAEPTERNATIVAPALGGGVDMPNNEGDEWTERQGQLWSALDLAMHALAFHVVRAIGEGGSVPRPAVRYLETARMIALEGLDFGEASRAALERVGTSNERVGRFSQGFLDSRADRLARDRFEAADADDLAELWGEHTGRAPSTDEEYEALIRELREIVDRSPDDPELQKLLDFVPGGSAKEVRERLSRRRGS